MIHTCQLCGFHENECDCAPYVPIYPAPKGPVQITGRFTESELDLGDLARPEGEAV